MLIAINWIAGHIVMQRIAKTSQIVFGNHIPPRDTALKLTAGFGIHGTEEIMLHAETMQVFMGWTAYGAEITQQADGATRIMLVFHAQIKQLKENAWILIIAGGNIMTGVIFQKAEHAEALEIQAQASIQRCLSTGIQSAIFLI